MRFQCQHGTVSLKKKPSSYRNIIILLRKNGQTVSEDNYLHTYHEILNGHTICSPFLVSDVIELGS